MKPDLSIEKQYSNYVICGVDEVGRGAWAGPVVVAGVIIDESRDLNGIYDSKGMTNNARELIAKKIKNEHKYAIAESTVEEIDKCNINQAIRLAVERVQQQLLADVILLDGNYNFNLSIRKINVIKGDSKSISIAAASIIAKVYRDRLMCELDKVHPGYMWSSNVGYGTPGHREALYKSGISKQHRKTYKPMKELL